VSQWKLDPVTGERVRVGGRFVRIEGADEILQNLRVRMRLIRGEVFLDTTAGPRYFDLVFVKGTPKERIEGELASEAARATGITAINRLELFPDYANRTAECEIEAEGSLEGLLAAVSISDRFELTTD
jgi:hypothetical protein